MNITELMNTWLIFLFVSGDLIYQRVSFYDGSMSAHTYTLIPQTAETALCVHEIFKTKTKLSAFFLAVRQSDSETCCLVRLIWDAWQATHKGHIEPLASSHKEFFKWDLRQIHGPLTEEKIKSFLSNIHTAEPRFIIKMNRFMYSPIVSRFG